MFLSYLLIDTEAKADRPRPGRDWIRNPYRVHQRLCMAFLSKERKEADPHFLDPFVPEEFQQPHEKSGQVHRSRDAAAGFLFRLDALPAMSPSRHVIAVQSATVPDWDYAFHNAPEFLAAKPKVVVFDPAFRTGDKFQFRLRANPTKRLRETSKLASGEAIDPKWAEKRVGLFREDEQQRWLEGKAGKGGFRLLGLRLIPEGNARATKEGRELTFVAVLFEGQLEVTDAKAFLDTWVSGVGSGKGMGFGMLSVAAG